MGLGRRGLSASPASALALALLLAGCSVEDYRNADLQLDVTGVQPADDALVRVCVADVTVHEEAAGAGVIAVTGLPANQTAIVQVEVAGGIAGPLPLGDETDFASVAWEACEECEPCDEADNRVAAGEDDWLLAVRFKD